MPNLFLRPPLLRSQRVLKVRIAHYHYISPFLLFLFWFNSFLPLFHTSHLLFPSMAKPPVSFRSFSNFAKVSSSFLQYAMCSFIESSKKSEGQEEEALPQEADTSSLSFSYFSYFTYFSFVLSPF